jgi:thiosulfate dehydrogenase [quinone] large subunit
MSTSSYRSQTPSISKWVSRWALLPLRLFLGITFIYAGLQKLTDPQFFNPSAHGYIGKQIAAFATGSPLHAFLLQVAVPHATLFGLLVSYGELAIGIGTMLGLLLRPAAFFGLLVSLLFFLSATWRVSPYFYGSDIVFVFCWLTLLIAGPVNTGLPSLDAIFVGRFLSPKQRKQLRPVTHFFLGVREEEPTPAPNPINYPQSQGKQIPGNKRPSQQQSRYIQAQHTKESRRNFLLGALTGGAGMLGLAWLWNILHQSPLSADNAGVNTATATPASTAPAGTPAATGATGSAIAQANSVQNNSSVSFTIVSSGDPGILVRLNNGKFVAYDAVCTHAGCPVDYDPSQQLLVCPCHGAAFDPAKAAAVVQGPANTPLTSVPINIDSTTGAITASQ